MNRELELVRLLEPEIAPPSAAGRARQRELLLETIDADAMRPLPIARTRRRSRVLKVLAATAVLTAVGGGAAFAWSRQATPDPKKAARFEQQHASGGAALLPGRPPLDAEHVVCDYEHVGRTPGLVYTFASDFPLVEPLTEQRIFDECRTGTDAVRTAPVRTPGVLCAVIPPGERLFVPVVAFGFATCKEASLVPVPPTLLNERNQMRQAEIEIRAVGSKCPTVAAAQAWVRAQVATTGADLRILEAEVYPEGQCWLPQVSWGRGEVRITAEHNDGSPGTAPPTTGLGHATTKSG
jgi:hypothetical protein